MRLTPHPANQSSLSVLECSPLLITLDEVVWKKQRLKSQCVFVTLLIEGQVCEILQSILVIRLDAVALSRAMRQRQERNEALDGY